MLEKGETEVVSNRYAQKMAVSNRHRILTNRLLVDRFIPRLDADGL